MSISSVVATTGVGSRFSAVVTGIGPTIPRLSAIVSITGVTAITLVARVAVVGPVIRSPVVILVSLAIPPVVLPVLSPLPAPIPIPVVPLSRLAAGR